MDTKWIEFFYQLGATTAGQVIILITLGFFGKQMIVYFFSETIEIKKVELSKDIENYKKTLNIETQQHRLQLDKILEKHRSELNLLNAKNSRLHDKQLIIIAELYKRIVVMERYFKEMTAWMKPVISDIKKEEYERISKAGQSFNDYLSYYSENRIFFSEETTGYLDKLRDHFWETHWDYTFKERTGVDDYKINRENLDNATKLVTEKIPEVLKQLDKAFRQLLTVE